MKKLPSASLKSECRRAGHDVHVVKTSNTAWEAELGPIPVTEIASYMERLEAEAEPVEGPPGARSVLAG